MRRTSALAFLLLVAALLCQLLACAAGQKTSLATRKKPSPSLLESADAVEAKPSPNFLVVSDTL